VDIEVFGFGGCASWSRAAVCCRPMLPANRQYVRRLLAGQGVVGETAARVGDTAGRTADRPLCARRTGGLSDLVQGPVRGGPIRPTTPLRSRPASTLELLPELQDMGIAAIKIEGRQRSPAYVTQVTKVWRAAIDACRRNPAAYAPNRNGNGNWARCRRAQTTLGAYTELGNEAATMTEQQPKLALDRCCITGPRKAARFLRTDKRRAGGHRLSRRDGLLQAPRFQYDEWLELASG